MKVYIPELPSYTPKINHQIMTQWLQMPSGIAISAKDHHPKLPLLICKTIPLSDDVEFIGSSTMTLGEALNYL